MVWAKSHQGKVYHSVQVYLPLIHLLLLFINIAANARHSGARLRHGDAMLLLDL